MIFCTEQLSVEGDRNAQKTWEAIQGLFLTNLQAEATCIYHIQLHKVSHIYFQFQSF